MRGTILKIGKAERIPGAGIYLDGWSFDSDAEFTPEELLEIAEKYSDQEYGPLTFGEMQNKD